MKKELRIGIDIGGQSTKCGVVDPKGTIIAQCTITSLQTELNDYLSDLTKAINQLIMETDSKGSIIGIGVGAPNANYFNGTIEYAPNIKWSKDKDGKPSIVQFAQLLKKRTSLPVTITNDANAAAMGEMRYGVARGIKNFIMITLGTGVGSGIVIDGKLVYGHDGFAGELGHVCAVPDGRLCGCGLKGCLETYASATGVAKTAKLVLKEDSRESILRSIDLETISSKDVFEAAVKGDEIAKEIFDYTGTILGHTLADFVKFSSPEAIVLFGGMTKSKDFFHESMVRTMNENLMTIWKNKIIVLYSSLRESDAAILGASALVE
jgi:glucokinase